MDFKLLSWDSDFFKYKVAEIKPTSPFDIENLNVLLEKLRLDKCKLAYLYISPDDISANEFAKSNNWFLADKKVTYSMRLRDISEPSEIDSNIATCSKDYLNEDMISLSIASAAYSRFKIDNNFNTDDYIKIYTEWLKKSVNREMADEVFIHKTKEKIDGIITVSLKEAEAYIGLLSVDELTRGRGIGTKLINSVINYCLLNKVNILKVVTQSENIKASKFYEKNNFKILNIINLYHIWL